MNTPCNFDLGRGLFMVEKVKRRISLCKSHYIHCAMLKHRNIFRGLYLLRRSKRSQRWQAYDEAVPKWEYSFVTGRNLNSIC